MRVKAGPKLARMLGGTRMTGAGGVAVKQTDYGSVFSLLKADWIHKGTIKAIIGGSSDVPAYPSTILYEVALVDRRDEVSLPLMSPINRTVRNNEVMVYPAIIGSLCLVIERSNAFGNRKYELIAFEGEPFGECGNGV